MEKMIPATPPPPEQFHQDRTDWLEKGCDPRHFDCNQPAHYPLKDFRLRIGPAEAARSTPPKP